MALRPAPLDAETKFCEGLTLAASDVVQLGGIDRILKIGKGRADMQLVVDVATIEIASNDELYTFLLQGCNTADFSTGSPAIENLAMLQLGATEVRAGGARDSVIGRYQVPCSNDMVGDWTYVRLNVIISGSIATGIKFSSWLSIPA
jgi:hypothetical protein